MTCRPGVSTGSPRHSAPSAGSGTIRERSARGRYVGGRGRLPRCTPPPRCARAPARGWPCIVGRRARPAMARCRRRQVRQRCPAWRAIAPPPAVAGRPVCAATQPPRRTPPASAAPPRARARPRPGQSPEAPPRAACSCGVARTRAAAAAAPVRRRLAQRLRFRQAAASLGAGGRLGTRRPTAASLRRRGAAAAAHAAACTGSAAQSAARSAPGCWRWRRCSPPHPES
mmetsp:Transcript_7325/g.26948  ORF Transcript_7325/g.26948 Transcript_7325/m.26948 type:complete len:228 (+) Transcript_7325:918-1601(+)